MPYIGQRSVQVHPVSAVTVPDINRVFTELANTETSLWAALQSGNLTVGGLKLDIQRTAVPGSAPGALDPNVVAFTTGSVTALAYWDGATWQTLTTVAALTLTPGSVSATPSAPSGTTSLTTVMMGLAVAFTPVKSPRAYLLVRGQMANNALNDGVTVQAVMGTGTAPANGDALTGTTVGAAQTTTALVAGQLDGFAVGGFVAGLTLGTPLWIDVAVTAVTGGTASVTNLTVDVLECF